MEFMDAQRKISNFSQREVEDAGEICYNPNWRIFGRRSAINSMTGYGRAARELDGRQLTVELKSVNHRFLDLNLRLPRSFLFLEEEARKRIGKRLSRGHVEGFFTYRNLRRDAKAVTVDEGLLEAYMRLRWMEFPASGRPDAAQCAQAPGGAPDFRGGGGPRGA